MKKKCIVDAVEESGLKKSYIAKQLGISSCYFSSWIKKPREMSMQQAYTLCRLLGMEMAELDFGVKDFFCPKT